MIVCPACMTAPGREFPNGPYKIFYCGCTRLSCTRMGDSPRAWVLRTGPLEVEDDLDGSSRIAVLFRDGELKRCGQEDSRWTDVPPEDVDALLADVGEKALLSYVMTA